MKPWVCINCVNEKGLAGKGFRAEKPVCPSCGADGSLPEYKSLISRCVETHYDPPHPVIRNRGTHKRLCDGKSIFDQQATNVATGIPACVSCPECLAHPDFPKDVEPIKVYPEADYQL